MGFDRLIITCEHGGNRVPRRYARLFSGADKTLESHRGYDPGALAVARALAKAFAAPLHFSTVTRLLIDLNRSRHHHRLFSEFTSDMAEEEQAAIVARYYTPYRTAVEKQVGAWCGRGCSVLHLSIHSFVPKFSGVARNAEIGLLYDPARRRESALCGRWREHLAEAAPDYRVRRNYPYLGKADGFATHLRRMLPVRQYCGIEVEVNQRLLADRPSMRRVSAVLIASLKEVLRGALG